MPDLLDEWSKMSVSWTQRHHPDFDFFYIPRNGIAISGERGVKGGVEHSETPPCKQVRKKHHRNGARTIACMRHSPENSDFTLQEGLELWKI